MDIDALIRMEHLMEDERQDSKALQKAVLRLLYQRGGPPMMRNAGDPNDGVTREDKHAANVCSNSFKGRYNGRMRCHIEGVVH